MYEFLEAERPSAHVLVLRLNRPDVLNAVNTKLGGEILDVFTKINNGEDDQTRCVVMTGTGEKSFCVGGDLKERNGMTDEQWQAQRVVFKAYNGAMERCPIPILCAVNGFALGGGAEMVLRADFSYAADDASFGFPEVKRGFMPGSGGTQRFSRIAGEPAALEYILTGDRFSAEQALAFGMINKIVPKAEVLAATIEVATRIAANPVQAVRIIKQVVKTGLQTDINTGLVIEMLGHQRLTTAADRLEGIKAFVEKRDPKWEKG